MPIKLEEKSNGKTMEVLLTGKLAREDYDLFAPSIERLVKQHGKIRMLLVMHDFHGWTAGGLWEDTKFDAKHFNDIERIAVVGETKWQHGITVFARPFTTATVRFFEPSAAAEARAWIEEP